MKTLHAVTMALALSVTSQSDAHHSFAQFDTTQKVELVGTVKEFDWTNPHTWIHLMVANDKGEIEEWAVELAGVVTLRREGWSGDSVNVGDKIKVTINPRKDGSHSGALLRAVTAKGETLTSYGAPAAPAVPAPNDKP
jgi:hypothetical protein